MNNAFTIHPITCTCVATKTSANEAIARPNSVEYRLQTITLPPNPDVEYDESMPYNPEHNTHEMMVLGDTGLAYLEVWGDEDPTYTVIHVPSGRFLNIGWFVETEQLAQEWIEWLLEFADWSTPQPCLREGTFFEAFALVSVGMLTDPHLRSASSAFTPVKPSQSASDAAA